MINIQAIVEILFIVILGVFCIPVNLKNKDYVLVVINIITIILFTTDLILKW